MKPPDLDFYIDDLRRRQEELLAEFDEISAKLEDVAQELSMAETVRANFRRHFKLGYLSEPSFDVRLKEKFAQLSIKDMLVRIAGEAGGILDLANARKILVRAGVFRDDRNAATSMAPILNRHEDTFKRIARGIYLLVRSTHCPNGSSVENAASIPKKRSASMPTYSSSTSPSGSLSSLVHSPENCICFVVDH